MKFHMNILRKCSISTLLADCITQIRVDYKGDSGIKQATSNKLKERSFDGLINCVFQPNLVNEHGMFYDYLRQRILSGNSVWGQLAGRVGRAGRRTGQRCGGWKDGGVGAERRGRGCDGGGGQGYGAAGRMAAARTCF